MQVKSNIVVCAVLRRHASQPKMQLAKLVAGTVILGILPYDSKSVSNKDLTDRESSNIGKFYFDILYNLNSYKYDRL